MTMHTVFSAAKLPFFPESRGLKAKQNASLVSPNVKLSQNGSSADRHRRSVQCKISYQDAEKLARHTLLDIPLDNKQEIFSRIKEPDDILLTNLATARLLSVLSQGASEETKRENQIKALFLWDKVGQGVVNETLKTWQDKINCLKGILQSLPEEMASLKKTSRPVSDSPLTKQEAFRLAESILHKKSLKNSDELLDKIKTSKDLLQIDRAASKVLSKMNENQPEEVVRANNLRYLFLMHRVGVQVTHTLIQCPEDFVQYGKHLLSGFQKK